MLFVEKPTNMVSRNFTLHSHGSQLNSKTSLLHLVVVSAHLFPRSSQTNRTAKGRDSCAAASKQSLSQPVVTMFVFVSLPPAPVLPLFQRAWEVGEWSKWGDSLDVSHGG